MGAYSGITRNPAAQGGDVVSRQRERYIRIDPVILEMMFSHRLPAIPRFHEPPFWSSAISGRLGFGHAVRDR